MIVAPSMSAPGSNRVAFGRGGNGAYFRSSPKADLNSDLLTYRSAKNVRMAAAQGPGATAVAVRRDRVWKLGGTISKINLGTQWQTTRQSGTRQANEFVRLRKSSGPTTHSQPNGDFPGFGEDRRIGGLVRGTTSATHSRLYRQPGTSSSASGQIRQRTCHRSPRRAS